MYYDGINQWAGTGILPVQALPDSSFTDTFNLSQLDNGSFSQQQYTIDLDIGWHVAPRIPGTAKPFAYVDANGMPRVVYRGDNKDIHELRLDGSWLHADLSALAPPAGLPNFVNNGGIAPGFAAGNPSAFVTPDGIPRVLYRGDDNDIHELKLQGTWADDDLSAIVGNGPATNALGDPFGYVDSSGVPRVVYRGTDNHIHELHLDESQGNWWHADLSGIVTNVSAQDSAGNPFGFVDANGILRVVYRGTDNDIHEIRWDGAWLEADLSAIVTNGAATMAAGDPFGFVDANGISRVVYLGVDSHIHEIRWDGDWLEADLSASIINPSVSNPNIPWAPLVPPFAAGDPRAYVTPDGITRVLYRGADTDIHEIRWEPTLGSWIDADLTTPVAGVPGYVQALGDPFAYVDWSGYDRVVYTAMDQQIHELYLVGIWQSANLSNPVGVAPGYVMPYYEPPPAACY